VLSKGNSEGRPAQFCGKSKEVNFFCAPVLPKGNSEGRPAQFCGKSKEVNFFLCTSVT